MTPDPAFADAMTRPTPRLTLAVLLLAAAVVILGAIGGIMQARAEGDDWPVTCDAAGCVPATATPVVWEAGRQ